MIAIIQYNAGNTASVQNALKRLGVESIITANASEIMAADKVIFPGVGEAASAMQHLRSTGIDLILPKLEQPVLGICLGMQLLCESSEEGTTQALGIFQSQVKRFPPKENVPHMGWNNLFELKSNLFNGVSETDDVYFVHSFYAEICEDTAAMCDYILPFSAALKRRNFYGTQFHPERSGSVGEKLLKNFLAL